MFTFCAAAAVAALPTSLMGASARRAQHLYRLSAWQPLHRAFMCIAGNITYVLRGCSSLGSARVEVSTSHFAAAPQLSGKQQRTAANELLHTLCDRQHGV